MSGEHQAFLGIFAFSFANDVASSVAPDLVHMGTQFIFHPRRHAPFVAGWARDLHRLKKEFTYQPYHFPSP
jgi:hypothetical protein